MINLLVPGNCIRFSNINIRCFLLKAQSYRKNHILFMLQVNSENVSGNAHQEYILDDDECPLAILMNHPSTRGKNLQLLCECFRLIIVYL